QKEETVKATAATALKPQAAKQRKTKTAPDSKPEANSPEPIVFNDLKPSSSHTIKLAYGAVNQRGSAFLSVDPFGKVLGPPAQNGVPSYKVVVEGDDIKVEVSE
ncbi:MAG TPA: hypothetical protein VF207_00945, partial [Chthoniobacterales bacterium]